MTEFRDCSRINSRLSGLENVRNFRVLWHWLRTKPQLPVELLDTIISSFHDFLDRCKSDLREVFEQKRQFDYGALGSPVLEHGYLDCCGIHSAGLNRRNKITVTVREDGDN